ncbi:MAB_1171c family putative transporter [Streptomyces sp. NPDC059985]|uniref:MAB_1171c family putative transporter n=1 Tax=Streptomyces sp. NPDC059985 TaxID=3347025 RepID=UPI0036C98DCA
MEFTDIRIPYIVPAVFFVVALLIKLPTLRRAFRDPNVRSTSLMLFLATLIFLSIAPTSVHRINTFIGISNVAAPWTYSLLTAFGGCCLSMLITWQDGPGPRRLRRTRRVWIIHAGIIAALWISFLMADVPSERITDLDTYYATTPWMREHILLYLLAHMASAMAAVRLILPWVKELESAWLRAGLRLLQAGYACGLVFDVSKLCAIVARWFGTPDWDFLSLQIAPNFALLNGILVALGFILPQAGPFLRDRWTDHATYRRLRPLWQLLHSIDPSPVPLRVRHFSPLPLRLMRRQTNIRDGLLLLAPHLDDRRRDTAFHTALEAGYKEHHARGVAGAIDILVAVDLFRTATRPEDGEDSAPLSSDLISVEPISLALRFPSRIEAIRRLAENRKSSHTDG